MPADTPRTAEPISAKKEIDWASLKPKSIGHEDAMSERDVKHAWNAMMAKAKLRHPSEETQSAFKLAVYVYLCVNGTSREGNYAQKIQMADGTEFEAAVIPQIVGPTQVRRFARGNMANAYEALKMSRAVEDDERYVARVVRFGVNPEQAFATADFFQDCPYFTPLEASAHEAARNFGLRRAAKARGGTLESVERARIDDALDAQDSGTRPDVSLSGRTVF